jgi:hypothetical protein
MIAGNNWNAGEKLAQVRNLLVGGSRVSCLHRGQQQRLRRLERNLSNRRPLVHSDLCVVTGRPIDHDQKLSTVAGGRLGRPGRRGPAARDQQDIAGDGLKPLQVVRVKAR